MTDDEIMKAAQLAKISKRIDELKERLESGSQLKADDIADKAVEYKVLKISYERILYEDMVLTLRKDPLVQQK